MGLACFGHGAPAKAGKLPLKTNVAEAAASAIGADVFAPGPLRKIKIEIRGAALDQLRRDDRRYARATFSDGEVVLRDVGIHVKGAAGSRRGFDDRPALTVNFDKFTPDQRWHGLEKIHLNNSVQDGSLLTENICGELFRQAGVPAPRAGNVRMEINGRDLGVYVIREGFDKTFLKTYFTTAKGNLYDPGFLRDIDQNLEKISGSESKEQPELKALVEASREKDLKKRWQRLNELVEMDRFISFCALEVMCWDWDGYVLKPNNYKIYWNPDTGRITFFPHGMDQMFWETRGSLRPGFSGMVARGMIETPEGKQLYQQRMTEILTNVFRMEAITNRIQAYATNIYDSLAARNKNAANDYLGQVRRITDLISGRVAYMRRELLQADPAQLKFQNGAARVTQWQIENEQGIAQLEKTKDADGRETLNIRVAEQTVASWRARVRLAPGQYRFEALARTAGVEAVQDAVGAGAGIRISGSRRSDSEKLGRDTPWQSLRYEFDVASADEDITLVCELRARKGQVWFDAGSLRLIRLK